MFSQIRMLFCYIINKALFYINYLCYICILLSANSVEEDYGQRLLFFLTSHFIVFIFSNFNLIILTLHVQSASGILIMKGQN